MLESTGRFGQEGYEMALKGILLVTLFVLTVAAGVGQIHAAPSFSGTSKQAVFLSPIERWMPTWDLNAYVSPLERAGYHVDVLLNENVSIAFLRTGLAKYDIIILRTESYAYEGFDYYCSGEPVTKARTEFSAEISAKELLVGPCVGFSILFLKDNYPANSLHHAFVYAVGSTTAALSSAFLSAGAAMFIGFYDEHSLQWGYIDSFSEKLFYYLAQGYTVNDAIIRLNRYIYTGHGSTADWPMLYCSGDGTFQI